MKRSGMFFLSLLFLLPACQEKGLSPMQQEMKDIVDEVQQKYAPDRRVAYFKMEITPSKNSYVLKGETTLPEAKAELWQRLEALGGSSVVDSAVVLPAPGLEGKHWGLVSVSVCNMRSEPKHPSQLVTQALMGMPLRVWNKAGDFYLVQSPDDYFGWVDHGGFVLMDTATYQSWLQSPRAVCLDNYAFAYEHPSENAQKVTDLVAGNIVQSLDTKEGFTQISLPDGRRGFVKSIHLLPFDQWLDTRLPDAEHILASARDLMGSPYLWGGTSGKGVDCSGLTKIAFLLNGIQLPRDANQQAAVGIPVETDTSLSNLQPGDLLFFGQKKEGKQVEKISHVAIYMGDGKIIHASDRVMVESLRRGEPDFSEQRLNSFVRARRMLGPEAKGHVVWLKDLPLY